MLGLLVAAMLATAPRTSLPAGARELGPDTPAQRIAMASRRPEFMYSGRRVGGKSWLGCFKARCYAQKFPGARVAICREERASMEATTLVTLRQEVIGYERWAAWWKESKSALYLPNGSEIHVFGLDKPGRALGARYGFMFVDQAEQLSEDQFEIANSCCMQVGMPWSQFFGAYNPEGPSHWAYLRYLPDDGDGLRFRENGTCFAEVVHTQPDDFMDRLTQAGRDRLDGMTGTLGLRLRWGKWVGFEGLVFDNFDPAFHVREAPASWAPWSAFSDRPIPPPSWPRYRGIDFGYVHPWACVWLTRAPGGNLLVYRYAMRQGLTIDDQCAIINRAEADELAALQRAAREQDEDTMRDHYAYLERLNLADSFSDHEAGHRALYDKLGVWTHNAKKDVRAGIETVRTLFDPRDVDPEGFPRLSIVKGSLMERDRKLESEKRPSSLEAELSRWVWRTAKSASGARATKDMPVEEGEDATKALIYACHSLEVRGSVGAWM